MQKISLLLFIICIFSGCMKQQDSLLQKAREEETAEMRLAQLLPIYARRVPSTMRSALAIEVAESLYDAGLISPAQQLFIAVQAAGTASEDQHRRVLRGIALSYLQQGNSKEAAAVLHGSIQTDDMELRLLRAAAFAGTEEYTAALRDFDEVWKHNPELFSAHSFETYLYVLSWAARHQDLLSVSYERGRQYGYRLRDLLLRAAALKNTGREREASAVLLAYHILFAADGISEFSRLEEYRVDFSDLPSTKERFPELVLLNIIADFTNASILHNEKQHADTIVQQVAEMESFFQYSQAYYYSFWMLMKRQGRPEPVLRIILEKIIALHADTGFADVSRQELAVTMGLQAEHGKLLLLPREVDVIIQRVHTTGDMSALSALIDMFALPDNEYVLYAVLALREVAGNEQVRLKLNRVLPQVSRKAAERIRLVL